MSFARISHPNVRKTSFLKIRNTVTTTARRGIEWERDNDHWSVITSAPSPISKHYYLFYIRRHLSGYFSDSVSYNRFVELMPHVFFHMMLFMKLRGFGKCSGISFVDSTMISVCHTSNAMPTRYSRVWPRTERGRWDGVLSGVLNVRQHFTPRPQEDWLLCFKHYSLFVCFSHALLGNGGF